MEQTDRMIQKQLEAMKTDRKLPPLPERTRERDKKPNEPKFDVRKALYDLVGLDLTAIEGINEITPLLW